MASTTTSAPASASAVSAIASALSSASSSAENTAAARPRVAPLRTKCITTTYPSEIKSPHCGPRSSGMYSAGPNSAHFFNRSFEAGFQSSSMGHTPLSAASLKRPRAGQDEGDSDDTEAANDSSLFLKTPITPPVAYMDFLKAVTPTASPACTPVGSSFPVNSATAFLRAGHRKSLSRENIPHSRSTSFSAPKLPKTTEELPEVADEYEDDSLNESDYLSDFTDISDEDMSGPSREATPENARAGAGQDAGDVRMEDTAAEKTKTQPSPAPAEEAAEKQASLPSSNMADGASLPSSSSPSPSSSPRPSPRAANRTPKVRNMEIRVPSNSEFVEQASQPASAHGRSRSTPNAASTEMSLNARYMQAIRSPGLQSPPAASRSKLRISTAVSAAAAAAATAAAAGLTPVRMSHPLLSPLPSAHFNCTRSPLASPGLVASHSGSNSGSGSGSTGSTGGGAPSIASGPLSARTQALPPSQPNSPGLSTTATATAGSRMSVCQVIQRTVTTISSRPAASQQQQQQQQAVPKVVPAEVEVSSLPEPPAGLPEEMDRIVISKRRRINE